MTDEQKADWVYAVTHAPAGVIFPCDRGVMEVYIVAADHHRTATRLQMTLDSENELKLLTKTTDVVNRRGEKIGGGNVIMSPYLGIISSSGTRMMRAASELGFTPAARPRCDDALDLMMSATGQARRGGRTGADQRTSADLDRLMARRAALN